MLFANCLYWWHCSFERLNHKKRGLLYSWAAVHSYILLLFFPYFEVSLHRHSFVFLLENDAVLMNDCHPWVFHSAFFAVLFFFFSFAWFPLVVFLKNLFLKIRGQELEYTKWVEGCIRKVNAISIYFLDLIFLLKRIFLYWTNPKKVVAAV